MVEQTSLSVNRNSGEVLRDRGIKRAIDHAESVIPKWGDMALKCVSDYPGKEFHTDEVRAWSKGQELPEPTDKRAWGAVMTKAKRDGLIEFIDYRPVNNPKAHRRPMAYWRKAERQNR